jgi:hypothetical protein
MKRQLSTDEIQDVIAKLDMYLSDLKTRWDQENPGNSSWWKVTQTYLLKSTSFIISILDELILFVESLQIPQGSDKKAAVIAMVGKLFDYIVIQAFPIWLRPFSGVIKEVVIGVIVNNLIDFIVAKYNSGYWTMQEANGTTNQVE